MSGVMTGLRRAELVFYRIIGVSLFRRFILLVEKWRHLSDGGTNRNYHLQSPTEDGMRKFTAYLLYNSVIHFASCVFAALYFILTAVFKVRVTALDVSAAAVLVLNAYCLMLQRYNFLRMQEYLEKYSEARKRRICGKCERILASFPQGISDRQIEEDLRFVQKMKRSLASATDLYIGGEDAQILRRMKTVYESGGGRRSVCHGVKGDCVLTVAEIAEKYAVSASPYSAKELAADRIGKILSKDRCGIISDAAVITEDADTDRAFTALFSWDRPEKTAEILDLLEKVYLKMLSGNNDEK